MSRLVFIVQNRIQRISIRSLRVCSHLAGCVGIFKPTDFVQRNHELRKLIKTKWTDLYIVKSNISFHFWRLISFLAISSRLWFNFGIFKYIYMKMFGIFMMIKWKKKWSTYYFFFDGPFNNNWNFDLFFGQFYYEKWWKKSYIYC